MIESIIGTKYVIDVTQHYSPKVREAKWYERLFAWWPWPPKEVFFVSNCGLNRLQEYCRTQEQPTGTLAKIKCILQEAIDLSHPSQAVIQKCSDIARTVLRGAVASYVDTTTIYLDDPFKDMFLQNLVKELYDALSVNDQAIQLTCMKSLLKQFVSSDKIPPLEGQQLIERLTALSKPFLASTEHLTTDTSRYYVLLNSISPPAAEDFLKQIQLRLQQSSDQIGALSEFLEAGLYLHCSEKLKERWNSVIPEIVENIWKKIPTMKNEEFNVQITKLLSLYPSFEKNAHFLTDFQNHAPDKLESWKTLIVDTLQSSIESLALEYKNDRVLNFEVELRPLSEWPDRVREVTGPGRTKRFNLMGKIYANCELFQALTKFAQEKRLEIHLSEPETERLKTILSASAPELLTYPSSMNLYPMMNSLFGITIPPVTLEEGQSLDQCVRICEELIDPNIKYSVIFGVGSLTPEDFIKQLPVTEDQKKLLMQRYQDSCARAKAAAQ